MLLILLLDGLNGLRGLEELAVLAAVLVVLVGSILVGSAAWGVKEMRSDKPGSRLRAGIALLLFAVVLFVVVTMAVLALLK
jgi:uncharacterized membrane protein YidH (DUF202 family)